MRSLLSMIAGPPGLMLFAAILGAIGALWASRQQAQFERELRLKSEEIAQLNKKTFDAVTGGDSFCYLSIYPHGEKASLMWNHHGEHTLYDVSARIVNLDRFEEVKKKLSIENLAYTDTIIELGTLIAGHTSVRGEILIEAFPKRGYNVFFAARNGAFQENIRLANINGVWKQAVRVRREEKVILDQIDEGYPRNATGEVEW